MQKACRVGDWNLWAFALHLWAYVLVGFCPRGFCPRGFCPRGFCPDTNWHNSIYPSFLQWNYDWLFPHLSKSFIISTPPFPAACISSQKYYHYRVLYFFSLCMATSISSLIMSAGTSWLCPPVGNSSSTVWFVYGCDWIVEILTMFCPSLLAFFLIS